MGGPQCRSGRGGEAKNSQPPPVPVIVQIHLVISDMKHATSLIVQTLIVCTSCKEHMIK